MPYRADVGQGGIVFAEQADTKFDDYKCQILRQMAPDHRITLQSLVPSENTTLLCLVLRADVLLLVDYPD